MLPGRIQFVALREIYRSFGLLEHLLHFFIPGHSLALRVERHALLDKNSATKIVLIMYLAEDALFERALADRALYHLYLLQRLLTHVILTLSEERLLTMPLLDRLREVSPPQPDNRLLVPVERDLLDHPLLLRHCRKSAHVFRGARAGRHGLGGSAINHCVHRQQC